VISDKEEEGEEEEGEEGENRSHGMACEVQLE